MNYTVLDPDEQGYAKVEKFNKEKTERLASLYSEILSLIGEDVNREGLLKRQKGLPRQCSSLLRATI